MPNDRSFAEVSVHALSPARNSPSLLAIYPNNA